MGWGDCGQDSQGRNIGYVWDAVCDHPGCKEKINRGLSYACGGMHGNTDDGCEKYFCGKHLRHACCSVKDDFITKYPVCFECAKTIEKYYQDEQRWDGWYWVEEDGLPVPAHFTEWPDTKSKSNVYVAFGSKDNMTVDEDVFDHDFGNFSFHNNIFAWKIRKIDKPNFEKRRKVSYPPYDEYGECNYWRECRSEINNATEVDDV